VSSSVYHTDDLSNPRGVAADFKALVLDIETGPNLAYVWGLWDQNIQPTNGQLVDAGTVLCFAAKWLGDPPSKVRFYSVHHDGYQEMIEAAWRLIDESDAVIHFNGKSFDMKHLNREFLLAGLAPPSPHKDIDLLTIAKSRFKFPSNKLDYISQALGVGQKVKHEGFSLWRSCLAGDPAAWKKMKQYNIGDIKITEEVYYKLRPWDKYHPHVGLYTSTSFSCKNCGSTHIQRRGYYCTPATRYQRFRCNDCGTWNRSRLRDKGSIRLDTAGTP